MEPYAAADHGAGIEDPDAAAEALVASLDQVELPEPDTTSPIEDPELAAVAEEMATRSQAREAAAEARQQRVAEAQADQAQRAAMREAAARDAEVHSPEAWVSGPRTPSWGGPEASTPEPTRPRPEAGGEPVGALHDAGSGGDTVLGAEVRQPVRRLQGVHLVLVGQAARPDSRRHSRPPEMNAAAWSPEPQRAITRSMV